MQLQGAAPDSAWAVGSLGRGRWSMALMWRPLYSCRLLAWRAPCCLPCSGCSSRCQAAGAQQQAAVGQLCCTHRLDQLYDIESVEDIATSTQWNRPGGVQSVEHSLGFAQPVVVL